MSQIRNSFIVKINQHLRQWFWKMRETQKKDDRLSYEAYLFVRRINEPSEYHRCMRVQVWGILRVLIYTALVRSSWTYLHQHPLGWILWWPIGPTAWHARWTNTSDQLEQWLVCRLPAVFLAWFLRTCLVVSVGYENHRNQPRSIVFWTMGRCPLFLAVFRMEPSGCRMNQIKIARPLCPLIVLPIEKGLDDWDKYWKQLTKYNISKLAHVLLLFIPLL